MATKVTPIKTVCENRDRWVTGLVYATQTNIDLCVCNPPPGRTVPVFSMELELAPGGDLFDLLYYATAFDERVARSFFRQALDGLNWCHTNKVAHRDLKPDNLLLDQFFNLKIADFGLASKNVRTRSHRSSIHSLLPFRCIQHWTHRISFTHMHSILRFFRKCPCPAPG